MKWDEMRWNEMKWRTSKKKAKAASQPASNTFTNTQSSPESAIHLPIKNQLHIKMFFIINWYQLKHFTSYPSIVWEGGLWINQSLACNLRMKQQQDYTVPQLYRKNRCWEHHANHLSLRFLLVDLKLKHLHKCICRKIAFLTWNDCPHSH